MRRFWQVLKKGSFVLNKVLWLGKYPANNIGEGCSTMSFLPKMDYCAKLG